MNPPADKQQPTLPSTRIYSEPVLVRNNGLGRLIVEAARDGFEAYRLDVVAGGYKVFFQRMDEPRTPQPATAAGVPGQKKETLFEAFESRVFKTSPQNP